MRVGRIWVLVCSLAIGSLLAGEAASQERVLARAVATSQSGRVIFEWPRSGGAVDYTLDLQGTNLVVRFSRPLVTDVSKLADQLPGYISSSELSQQGRQVTIRLRQTVEVTDSRRPSAYGQAIAVVMTPVASPPSNESSNDVAAFLPPSDAGGTTAAGSSSGLRAAGNQAGQRTGIEVLAAPKELKPAEAPKLKAATEQPAVDKPVQRKTPAQAKVRVRFGDHPDFTRIVFDWGGEVGYRIDQTADKLRISFDRQADIDLTKFAYANPRNLRAPLVQNDSGGARSEFTIPLGADVRHFRNDGSVVVDVYNGKPGAVAETAVAEPPKKAKSAATTLTNTDPVSAEAKSVAAPAQPAKSPTKPAPATVAETNRTQAQARSKVPTRPTPLADVTISEPPKPAPVIDVLAGDVGDVVVSAFATERGARMTFAWPELTAGAVAMHAGHLWVIFDREEVIDLAALKDTTALYGVVAAAEQFDIAGASVLRFKVDANLRPHVTRENATWIIDLRSDAPRPESTIAVTPEPFAPSGPRVFLAVIDSSKPVEVIDPESGSNLIFVPVGAAGFAVTRRFRYVEFAIASTAQGILVLPHVDGLTVRKQRSGVAVSTPDGLLISRAASNAGAGSYDTNGNRSKPTSSLSPEHISEQQPQVFKYREWLQGPLGDFLRNERALLQRLSRAPASGRNLLRFDLARFYFAHDLPHEALAVLRRIEETDRRVGADPDFRALRGAALLMAGRAEEAESDLQHPDLENDAEVALWRGMLAVEQKDWEAAATEFAVGLDAMPMVPDFRRGRFRLAMIQLALETNEFKTAESHLEAIRHEPMSKANRSRARFAEARYHQLTGDLEDAIHIYDELVIDKHLPTQIRAKIEQVKLLQQMEELTVDEAINKFEALRFAWRGDEVELDLLRRLGQYYIEAGKYRKGLSVMRQAVAYFPETEGGRTVAREMNQIFSDLFLHGKADDLAPINALGLYYDFRELTPVGAAGDEMIRRLADRLVAVDLLPSAAELLEHQVNFRLQGENRAKVGTRLAIIYLLDRKPEDALRTLRVSQWPRLEDELKTERRHLEARAMSDLERYDEALTQLQGDESHGAAILRSDIHWRSKNWPEAATSLTRLLEAREQSPDPLSPIERQQVMQLAIALALAENNQELQTVRDKFSPMLEGLPEANAFQVITAGNVDRSQTSFRNLAGAIAQVNELEAFMTSYRDRLRDDSRYTAE